MQKSSKPSDDTPEEGSFYPTVQTGLYSYAANIVKKNFFYFFTMVCFSLIKMNVSFCFIT